VPETAYFSLVAERHIRSVMSGLVASTGRGRSEEIADRRVR